MMGLVAWDSLWLMNFWLLSFRSSTFLQRLESLRLIFWIGSRKLRYNTHRKIGCSCLYGREGDGGLTAIFFVRQSFRVGHWHKICWCWPFESCWSGHACVLVGLCTLKWCFYKKLAPSSACPGPKERTWAYSARQMGLKLGPMFFTDLQNQQGYIMNPAVVNTTACFGCRC